MTVDELLAKLSEHEIVLTLKGDKLVIRGEDKVLESSTLLASLRENKQQLIEMIKAGAYVEPKIGGVQVPPNLIPAGCIRITPEMLTLVSLSQTEIDSIVEGVSGGAANVQDIYPLVALQEGILFHHLLEKEGDPYLLQTLMSFDSRARMDEFIRGLQRVVDRHDVFRTAVRWEGLSEPVQVVWRQASLVVEEVTLQGEDIAQQLRDKFNPRHYRLDVRQAPLMRLFVAKHEDNRWTLLWLHHHLSGDHTTLEVVWREIRYHLLHRDAELPAPLGFRNFVAQARLGVSREEHEVFFKGLLGEVTETTAPFGLMDIQGDGSKVVEARREMDASLAIRLRQRARALGVSVASVCHLAFAQLLSRVSGREDVVFGTVLMGRMQGGEGSDWVPGLFINTLPVRIGVTASVEQSVRDTHSQLAKLLRHEHASLALAQRCSGVHAPAPLSSACLNYRHNRMKPSAEIARAWEGVTFLGGEEHIDSSFLLSVDDFGDRFGLTAQVQSPIDPSRVCDYMHTVLANLVEALERSPQRLVRSVEVLPDAERRKILEEWNATQVEYPQERCVHELFEAQVARSPQAVAVLYEDKQLTYEELNHRSNQLAHYLRSEGISTGDLVGLCMERSVEMVVGILGILKAGAAYVPLDPSYPSERLEYMLQDASPRAVLTQEKLKGLVSGTALLVSVDAAWEQIALHASDNLDPSKLGINADHLAYVIYTSGSTGKPKGVLVEHHNVSRLFSVTAEWFHFNEHDVWTLFHSIAFDFSVWELWGALLHGGRLVVVPQSVSRSPQEFYELLCREKVTVLNQTPSAFRQLILAQQSSDQAHGLRCVIFGGEALEPLMLKPWYEQKQNTRTQLVNMYGITETTVHVTYRPLEAVDTQLRGSPIGQRIGDLRIYILDNQLQLAPIGVIGEIYVAGAGVARGYLNRADLTAERFIADPYASESGKRMYKTGDLGRYLADGNIEFLGRNDHQVKVRGFRIELGEIEAKLCEHALVNEAIVVAREDQGDKRLVAYYTRSGTDAVSAELLRSHLQTQLPEYMVPAAYVEMESWPLTSNGKLDRKALPAPDGEAYATREYVAPEGETEELLAKIWSELLGVERVGRHDNFFELGGHSLTATRLIVRIRQITQADISLETLLLNPTIASIAEAVLDAQLAKRFASEQLEELAAKL